MTLISSLLALRSPLVGSGVNHESQSFVGRMEVAGLVLGKAAMLTYTATAADDGHLHAESTLLAEGPTGTPCLWPVMEELPFVLPHPQVESIKTDEGMKFVFSSGPRDARETFREEIVITLKQDGSVIYAHSWGMPGGDFDERSSCLLHQSAA
jgi:hypothetical protein